LIISKKIALSSRKIYNMVFKF